jgi:hypothetical protein
LNVLVDGEHDGAGVGQEIRLHTAHLFELDQPVLLGVDIPQIRQLQFCVGKSHKLLFRHPYRRDAAFERQ